MKHLNSTAKRSLDPIIRKGDLVRVLETRWVSRVGYPNTLDHYVNQVEQAHGEALRQIFRKVNKSSDKSKQYHATLRNLAYLAARADQFGGFRRELFFEEMPSNILGQMAVVGDMFTVKTGNYYPPKTGEDYEPGGLRETKTWRLAQVKILQASYLQTPQPEEAKKFQKLASSFWSNVPKGFLVTSLQKMKPCLNCSKAEDWGYIHRTPHKDYPNICAYCSNPFEPVDAKVDKTSTLSIRIR